MFLVIDKMGANVVFDNFSHQPRHRAASAGNQMHHSLTAGFFLQSPFDGLNLSSKTAHTSQEFLFLTNCM